MQKENEDATPQTPYNMVHWLNWFHNIICTLIPMCNHQNKQENQYRCRRKPHGRTTRMSRNVELKIERLFLDGKTMTS